MAPKAKPQTSARKTPIQASSPAPEVFDDDVVAMDQDQQLRGSSPDVEVVEEEEDGDNDHPEQPQQAAPRQQQAAPRQQQPAQQPPQPPPPTQQPTQQQPPAHQQRQQQQQHPQPPAASKAATQPRAASMKPDHGASSTILGSVPAPWDARPAKRERSRGPVESDNDASGTPSPLKQGCFDTNLGQGAAGAGMATAGRKTGHRPPLPSLTSGAAPPAGPSRASPMPSVPAGPSLQTPAPRIPRSSPAAAGLVLTSATLYGIANRYERMAQAYREIGQLTENIDKGVDGFHLPL
ncbi:hypothetical protein DENSPDRAFT_886211 [Dentipellis sp. KUC8613]|nr:hypothetical protein DENSPDRAFT_886211 [Dentipellis sp. KUC8613]